MHLSLKGWSSDPSRNEHWHLNGLSISDFVYSTEVGPICLPEDLAVCVGSTWWSVDAQKPPLRMQSVALGIAARGNAADGCKAARGSPAVPHVVLTAAHLSSAAEAKPGTLQ